MAMKKAPSIRPPPKMLYSMNCRLSAPPLGNRKVSTATVAM